jgi:hypothetical protein
MAESRELMAGSETHSFPDGRGGTVSASVAGPRISETLLVLAHGAGNDMHQPLLVAVQQQLAAGGLAVARFNFPYTERGARAPDPAPVLETCWRAVLAALREALEPRRLVIGGKSLGGRMASHLAAQGAPVDGLVFLGYPLHPAGRPDALRTAHLDAIAAPMLFFAGTRDPLCRLDLLRATLATLPAPTTLHVIEDGDHSFAVPKRAGRSPAEVYGEIVRVTAAWLAARERRVGVPLALRQSSG